MSKRLVKRMQRTVLGGKVYFRIYDDGTVRVRADHPSDDPSVETIMAGLFLGPLRDAMRSRGIDPKVGPLTWRSDPPKVRE